MEEAEENEEELQDELEEESGSDEAETEDLSDEASLDELLAKRAAKSQEDDPGAIFELTQQDKPTSGTIRTIPKKAGEFVCSNCRLIKSNSQLADRKRGFCNDCV